MDQVYRLIVDMSTRGSLIPETGKIDPTPIQWTV